MVEPLGTEVIRIVPDTTGFRETVQAQVTAALAGVRGQIAATQAQVGAAAAAASRIGTTGVSTPLPTGVTAGTQQAVQAQNQLAAATTKATTATVAQGRATSTTTRAQRDFDQRVQDTERSLGRTTRGLIASTAASTGLFRAVSFASGAFLAGALAGATAAAAIREFADASRVAAQTAAIIESTGGAALVTAEHIDALAAAQLRLTGVDDELIKSSANVILTFRGIQNAGEGINAVFDRAVRAALDISNVLGTNLRSSSIQVGKALQDPVRGVTALRRAGISLSQAQRNLIKDLVATGQTLRAQRIILTEIETQVGGTAAAVGQTLPGQLNILRERASNALGEFARRLSESADAARLANNVSTALSQTWNVLVGVVSTLGPPLLRLGEGLAAATQAVGGVGTILAAAAAYKAVTVSARLATAAQALYTRSLIVGTGASRAQAVATLQLTAAQRASAAATGAMALASRALGGPVGIAALTVGALVVGAIVLKRRADNAAGSVNAFRRAVEDLDAALERGQAGQDARVAQIEAVNEAALDARDATRQVTEAEQALNESRAGRGSVERLALEDQLRAARERQTIATDALSVARARLASIEFRNDQRQQQRAAVIENTTRKVLEQVAAINARRDAETAGLQTGAAGANDPALAVLRAEGAARALEAFQDRMRGLIDTGGQASRVAGSALLALSATLDRVATPREIRLAFRLAGEGRLQTFLLEQLNVVRETSGIEEIRIRNALQLMSITGQTNASLQGQATALRAILEAEQKRLREIKARQATQQKELDQANETVTLAKEALTNARQAVTDSRLALRDTLEQAREAVNQAVNDAKANLLSIADTVAEALGRIADEGGGRISKALSTRFKELRDTIIRGEGGPETFRAAQQVSFLAQQQQAVGATDQTDKIRQRLADLADGLNRGTTPLVLFNRRLNQILRDFRFDPAEFRRRFGPAAANALLAQIRALRQQAGLNVAGPPRAGGVTIDLVNPMKAVRDSNRQIAQAQEGIRDAQRNVGRAIKDLAEAEREADLANRRLLRRNALASEASLDVERARLALEKARAARSNRPKPQGRSGRDADEVVSAGARGSPR